MAKTPRWLVRSFGVWLTLVGPVWERERENKTKPSNPLSAFVVMAAMWYACIIWSYCWNAIKFWGSRKVTSLIVLCYYVVYFLVIVYYYSRCKSVFKLFTSNTPVQWQQKVHISQIRTWLNVTTFNHVLNISGHFQMNLGKNFTHHFAAILAYV